MSDKPISGFDDGEAIRTSDAVIVFAQNGANFKGSIRPNPPRQINVLNQTPQLEAELGSNLEISNNTGRAIVIDDAFLLTESFKIGTLSTLNMYASTPDNTLTSTASPIYENLNPLNGIQSLDINNLLLVGDGTNSVFDTHGSAFSLTRFRDAIFANFDSIGTVNTGMAIIGASATQGVSQGLIINEPVDVIINTFGVIQFAALGITAVSIIAGATPVTASIIDLRGSPLFPGDSLLFIDPNSPPGSRYTISNSNNIGGDFYQLGVDIVITSVIDNGNGKARFITATPHNLIARRPTVLSGFLTEVSYNKTAVVTAVDTDLTGVTFDVDDITFTGTDTGNVNNKSLDQTSPLVFADKNSSSNSMFTGDAGLETVAVPIEVTINTEGVPEIITDVNWMFNNLESFTIGASNEGQLITNDPSIRKYRISYSGSIGKIGGGGVNVGLVILKNGVDISFNPPHRAVSLVAQISREDIIELTENDTIQVGVVNYQGTSNISIEQISMVISLA
jgi:hypothetical protein